MLVQNSELGYSKLAMSEVIRKNKNKRVFHPFNLKPDVIMMTLKFQTINSHFQRNFLIFR